MLLRITRTRSLHSRHAVASHFSVFVRLGQRPASVATAAAVNGSGVRRNLVPAYNSADWAQDNERRVAAQQRERPGRARFSTSPVPTMSPQSAQTIGMS
jgi:hypothetical protein